MKNQTLKTFALALVMFFGLGLTVNGTASGSPAPQRPQMPRPYIPPPPPRPMPTPAPRPAAEPRQEPVRREPQPAPRQDQTQQRQQQQLQAGQQRQAQQRQAQQQQEQREQARQQKLQAEQQKHEAGQQKEAQKQQQKLQDKQNKEQARLQTEREKQQEKQRKEQERQQKQDKSSLGRSAVVTTPKSADASVMHSTRDLAAKSAGRQVDVRANGSIASYTDHGKTATFDRRGKLSSVHTASMDIHRGQRGERRIVSRLPDNTTVVTTGRHNGYVERRFVVNNHTYTQRTVILNGRVYTRAYASYVVNGVVLHHFVAPVFYAPGFYGWAYYPWGVPLVYRWAWVGAPWYVGPNPYFVAYPVYSSAEFWLTDYYLGQTLFAAAQEDADAMANGDRSRSDSEDDSDATAMLRADDNTPITPEIKSAIAEEVMQQIAYDNTSANDDNADAIHGELPAALRSVGHVFVVSDSLDVTTSDQQSCGLQTGDVLRLTAIPADGTGVAELRVASGKKMDCPAGVQVTVSLQDLQDMQDNFHEQIEQGLGVLQATQGNNGLPAAPADAVQIPPRPSLIGDTGTAGTMSGGEALALIDAQVQQAEALQADVIAAASQAKN